MENLLDELNKKIFYVPLVLRNKENKKYTKIDNNFYMMYSFLEGEPLDNLISISNDISIKLANLFFSKTKKTNIAGIKTFLNEYYKYNIK